MSDESDSEVRVSQKALYDLFLAFSTSVPITRWPKTEETTGDLIVSSFTLRDAEHTLNSLPMSSAVPQQAKASLCTRLIHARLIERVRRRVPSKVEPTRGPIMQFTPKGRHILERGATAGKGSVNRFTNVFDSQPICPRLLHLERDEITDKLVITPDTICALFRRCFRHRIEVTSERIRSTDMTRMKWYILRSRGISCRNDALKPRLPAASRDTFLSTDLMNWIADFTTVANIDEAGVIAAHLARFGLIRPLNKSNRYQGVYLAVGSVLEDYPELKARELFIADDSMFYELTQHGSSVARSHGTSNASHQHSNMSDPVALVRLQEVLEQILHNNVLRKHFSTFLRRHFYEDNLLLWQDAEDLKRDPSESADGERLVPRTTAALLRERFFSEGSRFEIDMDPTLQLHVMGDITRIATRDMLLDWLRPIQETMLENMARKWVLKFMRTPQFMANRSSISIKENSESKGPKSAREKASPLTLSGVYMTLSERGLEQEKSVLELL